MVCRNFRTMTFTQLNHAVFLQTISKFVNFFVFVIKIVNDQILMFST